MDIKRLLLTILTVLCVSVTGLSLVSSLNETQIQSRLELYQTNLLLRVVGLDSDRPVAPEIMDVSIDSIGQAVRAGFGQSNAVQQSLSAYETFQKSAEASLETFNERLDNPDDTITAEELFTLQTEIKQQTQVLAEVDLRIGLLLAMKQERELAQKQWNPLVPDSFTLKDAVNNPAKEPLELVGQTAGIASVLWRDDAGDVIQQTLGNAAKMVPEQLQELDGWFEDLAIARWLTLTDQTDALANLKASATAQANRTAIKLATVNFVPIIGLIIGVGLLIFLVIQRFVQKSQALLALNATESWDIPWSNETVLQVFVVGFFFVGQLVTPLLLGLTTSALGINRAALTGLPKASIILLGYGFLSIPGLWVLRYSIREYWPLAKPWFDYNFRDRWFRWGIGGYALALPLVVGISLVNQLLWQGRGGSNPILGIILENRDPWAIAAFFLTASIAAPLFEETLFRGFLLPSLTRSLSPWGAVVVSALVFAIAHLSLSEVLPLTVLGIVLGGVYLRTRNLVAPILLHGLWNSGTLISLLVLSNGGI
ncbi:MAG: type II CAAX endopeptidase family protein [Cyanobacteria bacterium P01_C01_bin.89]